MDRRSRRAECHSRLRRLCVSSLAGACARFLLLVGDASWDGKNYHPAASPDWAFRLSRRANFVQNGGTAYRSEVFAASRNLIPTWGYGSAEGHAAGDNAFVAIDGNDEFPDLAVGRFPVVEPQEVEAIVAKIVDYENAPVAGEWRSRLLWVTNEESHTQKTSDDLAAEFAERGFTSRKIYPRPVVPPNSDDQVALRSAFDQGALIVHFFGHGGRYIWRTDLPTSLPSATSSACRTWRPSRRPASFRSSSA